MMSVRPRRNAWLWLAVVFVAVLAAGGRFVSQPQPAPPHRATPTAGIIASSTLTPAAQVIPDDLIAPLLVYARAVEDPHLTSPSFNRYEVYTAGPGETPELAFTTGRLGTAPARSLTLLARQRQVLMNFGTVLAAYDLASGVRHDLYTVSDPDPVRGYQIDGMVALRNDGALLAFTEYHSEPGRPWVYHIKLLNLHTGGVQTIRSGDGSSDQGVFRGLPVPRAWLRNGEDILLYGMTFNENCCSWGRISLDGSGFTQIDLPGGLPSPDGRLFASNDHRGAGIGCYTPRHEVVVYDLATLQRSILVTEPELGVEVVGWSHESDAVAFRTFPLHPSSRSYCPAEAREPQWDASRYALAYVQKGSIKAIDEQRVAVWHTPGGADRVAIRCDDPNDAATQCEEATLELDGQAIARGGPFTVLGWLP